MLSRRDVQRASARIDGLVRRTPMVQGTVAGHQVWLKCEFMQHAGVFKTRGAFNRLLAARERGELDETIGIVAASGGNAGLANAFAAAALGVPARVFVPKTAPAVKVSRLREYGADVVQVGAEYAEAYDAATAFVERSGAVFCHAYDHVDVAAGAGTLAEEMLQAAPSITAVVVAVGGGGLFAGVSAAVRGRAQVIAVEPVRIPTLRSALEAGRPVDVPVSGVAADSLGARRVGSIAFEAAQQVPPVSVLVEDDDIVRARNWLWAEFRIPAEHGAAAAIAALTSGRWVAAAEDHVAVVICGSNTDLTTLA